MKLTHVETFLELGEVRFYTDGKTWRYIHAQGEGSGLKSLADAIAEIKAFIAANETEVA